jgi:SAM-dependent methyltransferase
VGCGAGTLLAAAAAEGREGIGIDVSLVWLVVAQRLITAYGGQPVLAAALAEALPLADSSVSGIALLDMIEHVADPARCLSEMNRVTKSGGHIALSTPNRYSLAAELHVFVWGVGWLPRSWQEDYVRWRTGKVYKFTRLLSTREMARLLRQNTCFQFKLLIPRVPEDEIAHFPRYRAILAGVYNHLVSLGWTHWLLCHIGPFFRVVGKKMSSSRQIGRSQP